LNASAPTEIMVESGIDKMTFKNSLTHKYFINFLFGEEIDGLEVWLNVFYSKKTDAKLYDNWTFPSNTIMDKFYYDNDTIILLNTPGLTIGKTSLK